MDPDGAPVQVRTDPDDVTRVLYRPSSIGSPLHVLVAARLGFTPIGPPPWVRRAMDLGTEYEGEILDAVPIDTVGAVTARQVATYVDVPDTDPLCVIAGTADLVVGQPAGDVVVDAKRVADSTYQRLAPGDALYERYRWQLSAYAAGLGGRDVTGALALGLHDSDPKDGEPAPIREVQVVPVDLVEPGALFDRVRAVEGLAAGDGLAAILASDWDDCTGWCPYAYLHPGDEVELIDDPVLEELIDLAAKAQRTYELADKHRARAREALQNALTSAGIAKGVTVTGVRATVVETKGRVRRDWKGIRAALVEHGVDPGDYETTGEPRTYLRLTVPDEEGDPDAAS